MASIVICGGSMIGLSSALLLARAGHRVTVLERDAAAPPPRPPLEAWDGWDRRGVAQFRQPHNLLPRFRHILQAELPGMVDRLLEAGCGWVEPTASLPPWIAGIQPGDDKFDFVTGRRPVVESVLALAAAEEDGIEIRRGVTVGELVTGDAVIDGVPHVTGVRTTGGEEITGDLVVDASGRRSKLSEWLRAAGGAAPKVESEDCGFVYHTRYFRGPEVPRTIGPPASEIGTISLLTIPGDNGTWSVTVWAASADTALNGLRDPDRFTRVVRNCPLHAHWLDGEAITGVVSMAGILDRYRRFVVDDSPIATGVVAVGDAWACTNPSAGRGITVGLLHAQCLRNTIESDLDDPEQLVRAWDAITEAEVAPFYRDQIAADRARFAQMDAIRQGVEPPAADPDAAAIGAAMYQDAEVFRGVLEIVACLARPTEVFARTGFMDKVRAIGDRGDGGGSRRQIPGPDRGALLGLLA